MTRTFKDIAIEIKKAYALFDTGSRRSCITNYESGIFLRSSSEASLVKLSLERFFVERLKEMLAEREWEETYVCGIWLTTTICELYIREVM